MSNIVIDKNKIDLLANAISTKSGEPLTLTLDEMVSAVDGITPTLQTKTATYTPTESQQTETITADSGYDGLSAVNVTVNAMPSGTAGTPSATKGSVSNHSVSVTPSVTNTTGYITGGTKTGTPVTVSASELVSGTKTISSSGTTNVTNYASASVASGSARTPATTITANPTISVSASGLITASISKTQGVTPTVSAGYVVTGTSGTITVNGSNTQQLTIYNGAHHSVVLISFKIEYQGNITTYSAVNGATWTEWVNSEYNTDGFYVDNNAGAVRAANGAHVDKTLDNPVDPAETIIDDTKYYLEHSPL